LQLEAVYVKQGERTVTLQPCISWSPHHQHLCWHLHRPSD
jgi:hypothetical protein